MHKLLVILFIILFNCIPESMSTNVWRKYHVVIKAMFWNGCCSYLSLLKPPSKKNINSWTSKNIGVQKTVLSKVAPSELPKSCCWSYTSEKWNIVIVISVRDGFLGTGISPFPFKKKKNVTKNYTILSVRYLVRGVF